MLRPPEPPPRTVLSRAPWDLVTAFNKTKVIRAGDTLWLRGGVYTQPDAWKYVVNLTGTAQAPIVIRRYPGEWAVLDLRSFNSSFLFDSSSRIVNTANGTRSSWNATYVWVWGLEITASGIPRSTRDSGPWAGLAADIQVHGAGIKFINCYVHDLSEGFSFWQDSIDAEMYGNIVLDNGWSAPDRGHGHNAYLQNTGAGSKVAENNFFGTAFDVGVQAYGSAAPIDNINLTGNALFDNGAPVGHNVQQWVTGNGAAKSNIVFNGNFVYTSAAYGPGLVQHGWQWDGRNIAGSFRDNLIWGPGVEAWRWDKLVFTGNRIFSGAGVQQQLLLSLYDQNPPPQSFAGWTIDSNRYGAGKLVAHAGGLDSKFNPFTSTSKSATDQAMWQQLTGQEAHSSFNAAVPATTAVLPNKYEPGRANIIVTNPGSAAAVTVDLSGAGLKNGDAFVIKDAQNFLAAPVAAGTYASASPAVRIPVAGLVRKRITGWDKTPSHTAPQFGTFVLLSGAAMKGVPVTPNP